MFTGSSKPSLRAQTNSSSVTGQNRVHVRAEQGDVMRPGRSHHPDDRGAPRGQLYHPSGTCRYRQRWFPGDIRSDRRRCRPAVVRQETSRGAPQPSVVSSNSRRGAAQVDEGLHAASGWRGDDDCARSASCASRTAADLAGVAGRGGHRAKISSRSWRARSRVGVSRR